jgi:hypothetical protein
MSLNTDKLNGLPMSWRWFEVQQFEAANTKLSDSDLLDLVK